MRERERKKAFGKLVPLEGEQHKRRMDSRLVSYLAGALSPVDHKELYQD